MTHILPKKSKHDAHANLPLGVLWVYVFVTDPLIICKPTNLNQIDQVLKQLGVGNAGNVGIYSIQGELLQAGGKAVLLALQAIFVSILETGIITANLK